MVSHTTRLVCYAIPLCPGRSHPDTKVRYTGDDDTPLATHGSGLPPFRHPLTDFTAAGLAPANAAFRHDANAAVVARVAASSWRPGSQPVASKPQSDRPRPQPSSAAQPQPQPQPTEAR